MWYCLQSLRVRLCQKAQPCAPRLSPGVRACLQASPVHLPRPSSRLQSSQARHRDVMRQTQLRALAQDTLVLGLLIWDRVVLAEVLRYDRPLVVDDLFLDLHSGRSVSIRRGRLPEQASLTFPPILIFFKRAGEVPFSISGELTATSDALWTAEFSPRRYSSAYAGDSLYDSGQNRRRRRGEIKARVNADDGWPPSALVLGHTKGRFYRVQSTPKRRPGWP